MKEKHTYIYGQQQYKTHALISVTSDMYPIGDLFVALIQNQRTNEKLACKTINGIFMETFSIDMSDTILVVLMMCQVI